MFRVSSKFALVVGVGNFICDVEGFFEVVLISQVVFVSGVQNIQVLQLLDFVRGVWFVKFSRCFDRFGFPGRSDFQPNTPQEQRATRVQFVNGCSVSVEGSEDALVWEMCSFSEGLASGFPFLGCLLKILFHGVA